MKNMLYLFILLVLHSCSTPQKLPLSNIAVYDSSLLYTLSNKPFRCPRVSKISQVDTTSEYLWINSSDAFNSSSHIWDIYNGNIYTWSIMDSRRATLIAIHKNNWTSLIANNQYAETSNIYDNVNNWPNDEYRMGFGSQLFREVRNLISSRRTAFADILIDDRLRCLILNIEEGTFSLWQLSIDPANVNTEGLFSKHDHNKAPKPKLTSGKWEKIAVFPNEYQISTKFDLFSRQQNDDIILIDDLGDSYAFSSNGSIQKTTFNIKPKSVFIKDKDNKKTYIIKKRKFDKILTLHKLIAKEKNRSILFDIQPNAYLIF